MTIGRKIGSALGLLLLGAVFLCGCDGSATEALPTDVPGPTPELEPQVVSLDIIATPTPFYESLTPEPSPTPSVTEVPFSHYAPTVDMTFEELVGGTSDFGEIGDRHVNWPQGYPPADTYRIIVDVEWQVVMVYTKDENGEYTVPVRYMLCSTGNPRITDGSETRRGTFQMLVPRVRFGHFLSGEAAQYWSLIRGRTYFHSILYDKAENMSTYQVETYNALGSKDSHGCIRLTVPDARWIWYNIAYGTVCEIRDGDKNDTATKAIREQLILPAAPSTRATIKAGTTPYTDNWTIDTVLSAFAAGVILPFKNEKQPAPAMTGDDGSDDGDSVLPGDTGAGDGTGGATGDGTGGTTGDGAAGGTGGTAGDGTTGGTGEGSTGGTGDSGTGGSTGDSGTGDAGTGGTVPTNPYAPGGESSGNAG